MSNLKATRTVCTADAVSPVYTTVEAMNVDFLTYFKSHFRIYIISETEDELIFDFVGIDAPLANALRRILLAEVPTMAIETVYIYENTSIIQDEILSHRLGLIPIKADPRLFDYVLRLVVYCFPEKTPPRKGRKKLQNSFVRPEEGPTDMNTLVFNMQVQGKPALPNETQSAIAVAEGDEDIDSTATKIYSSAIEWVPQGSQAERLEVTVAPVHDDILVAKLAPGQTINVEAHAVKGIGKDHAKFSPVSTATYRLLPQITLSETAPFLDDEADKLVNTCPVGVFDIEDLGKGRRKGIVARPRDCTLCRECVRDPAMAERVTLERINDHFIFSVESTGSLPARIIVQEAIKILAEKAKVLLQTMEGNSSSNTDNNSSNKVITATPTVPVMSAARAERTREAAMRNPEEEVDI